MKQKLLSPTELKEFRIQQEEQRKLRAEQLSVAQKQNKRLSSPKELLDPTPVVEVVEEVIEEPKNPIEVLNEKVEDIASSIKEPKYYEEEISSLEVLLASKLDASDIDLNPIKEDISSIREYLLEVEEIKTQLKESKDDTNQDIKKLTDRVDQLQISGSEIFTQHGENIKEIKKIIHSLLKDVDNINLTFDIPQLIEKFSPTGIPEVRKDIIIVKEKLFEQVDSLKNEIKNLPKVKYYDEELSNLTDLVENVKSSIPEVPEVKYYESELIHLLELIEQVRSSIPELPEVRYYEDEISDLYKKLYSIQNKIPEIPEIPEVKYYDKDIRELNDTLVDVKDTVDMIKMSMTKVSKTVNDNVKEQVDWTNEIDYLYDEMNKLKRRTTKMAESYDKNIEQIKESFEPKIIKEEDEFGTTVDTSFVTFEDLSQHYRVFINRIQQQLASVGGGGEVNLRNLDDVDFTTAGNGRLLAFDSTVFPNGKFVFISPEQAQGGDGALDKSFEYNSIGLSTLTTSEGTKTFLYNEVGILTGIIGSGIYASKELTYDQVGNLIFIDII